MKKGESYIYEIYGYARQYSGEFGPKELLATMPKGAYSLQQIRYALHELTDVCGLLIKRCDGRNGYYTLAPKVINAHNLRMLTTQ